MCWNQIKMPEAVANLYFILLSGSEKVPLQKENENKEYIFFYGRRSPICNCRKFKWKT